MIDEAGLNRHFRRLREGVFDEDDLRRRAHELARFVVIASMFRACWMSASVTDP